MVVVDAGRTAQEKALAVAKWAEVEVLLSDMTTVLFISLVMMAYSLQEMEKAQTGRLQKLNSESAGGGAATGLSRI
jgi:hypothetical protein